MTVTDESNGDSVSCCNNYGDDKCRDNVTYLMRLITAFMGNSENLAPVSYLVRQGGNMEV